MCLSTFNQQHCLVFLLLTRLLLVWFFWFWELGNVTNSARSYLTNANIRSQMTTFVIFARLHRILQLKFTWIKFPIRQQRLTVPRALHNSLSYTGDWRIQLSYFVLYLLIQNTPQSIAFIFLVQRTSSGRKTAKGIQHKKPGVLKQQGNSASWRAKQPCSESTWLLEVPIPGSNLKPQAIFYFWPPTPEALPGRGRQDECQPILSKALMAVLLLQPPPLPSLNIHHAPTSVLFGSASALLCLWTQ